MGYRIKHLGVARRTAEGIELRVHPTLIPADRLIANVNGVMNAVMVNGDAAGSTLYYGAGAGMEPTASSVVGDLVDVVRAIPPTRRTVCRTWHSSQTRCRPTRSCRSKPAKAPTTCASRPRITRAYWPRSPASSRSEGINIESIMQKEAEEQDGLVPMILVTHGVVEQRINDAIVALEALQDVVGKVVRIRVEQLN